ncbi:hypothetical protein F2Q69_00048386 [Brassica cretica]|uniref:Uncharacterized protein n=1 Tax=Brassica cretica TaxID=69181 RepID=A0A8S9PWN2_BRACR|nr:hypothetical protein F2Q69_00048386 [Brassica cretica]
MADIKGKCILYEDKDEPIHLVDQNDSHTMREYQNGQVIGALQGMEIGDSTTTMVDQEKETRVESDVQGDDLLGEDLEAMEEAGIPYVVQSKKVEFLRQGSPRKRHSNSVGLPSSGETEHPGNKLHIESRKDKVSSYKDNGL